MDRYQQIRTALGSDALITLICKTSSEADRIFSQLWKITEEFEKSFSRFLFSSELSRINTNAGKRMACSQEMRDLLRACKIWGERTDGVFNPFILPRLVEAGYSKSWINRVSAPNLPRAKRVPNISELEIGERWVMIPEDSAIDVGGIGKGYLLDQLANFLQNRVDNYWLSFGGDILVHGTDLDQKPWSVGIASSIDDLKTIATVELPVTGRWSVTTSGTNRRGGIHNSVRWHHLINPLTGLPAQTDIVTASLISQSGLIGDVLASCAVILGSEQGQKLLEKNGINDYLFQFSSQSPQITGRMLQLHKENHEVA